jgi:putative salt-induced outer membrane protein YdiY
MIKTVFAGPILIAASLSMAQDAPPPTAAAPAPAPIEQKKPAWESSVAAGLTLTKGNSDTVVATINALTSKKWGPHELRFGADASYGENTGIKSTEVLHGFSQYNYLFSERMFGYGRLDGVHDSIADIEYRFTLGPGIGYYVVKNATTSLSLETGPAYVLEKQGGVERGYMTVRVAERLEHQINERVKIWESVEFLPQVDNFNNYIINAEVGIETELVKNLALRVFAQDTYDNEPAPGREKNDVKLVTAVAYKF